MALQCLCPTDRLTERIKSSDTCQTLVLVTFGSSGHTGPESRPYQLRRPLPSRRRISFLLPIPSHVRLMLARQTSSESGIGIRGSTEWTLRSTYDRRFNEEPSRRFNIRCRRRNLTTPARRRMRKPAVSGR
jgi:hypothetical protein